MNHVFLSALIVIYTLVSTIGEKDHKGKGIWFDKSAQNWNEAIPIGNGTLGGMVYGGVESDTIEEEI